MKIHVNADLYIELSRNANGKEHRIVLYRSSSLERRKRESFMKKMGKIILKVKKIIDSGNSDSMAKARAYLESENLNETILLSSLAINQDKMDQRLSMMGKNALFTNIMDMEAEGIIDLYRKRNRVEHCFRTINAMDIAFPVYQYTTEDKGAYVLFPYGISLPCTHIQ